MNIDNYMRLAQGISKLFHPLVEVVIHDLGSKTIMFIEGSFSKRKIGDPSLLEDNLQDLEQEFSGIEYTKLNFDGRFLKSISIPIKERGEMVALFCINYDMTIFQEMQQLVGQVFCQNISKQPAALFKNDWQERINQFIHQLLKAKDLHFVHLTNKDKKFIVEQLFQQGAFSEKNAADYIAKILDMSRSTIFNYLRVWKENKHEL